MFNYKDLKEHYTIIMLKKDEQFIWISASRDPIGRVGGFYLYKTENLQGMSLYLASYDNKEEALNIKNQLIREHKPLWNSKRGRPAIEEKQRTGLTHKERLITQVEGSAVEKHVHKLIGRKKKSNLSPVDALLSDLLDDL
jgi:hypothetical protein